MRRGAAPQPIPPSTRPLPTPPSSSHPDSTASVASVATSHDRAPAMAQPPAFSSVFAPGFAPSAVCPTPSSPSLLAPLPKAELTTMMADSGNLMEYATPVRRTESLLMPSAPLARGNTVASVSEEDGAAAGGDDDVKGDPVSDSVLQQRHQPLPTPPPPQRRPRPLPYPSPTAAMSSQLIRDTSAAAMAAEVEYNRMNSRNGAKGITTATATVEGAWTSRGVTAEVRAGALTSEEATQAPRLVRLLPSPSAATVASSYVSAGTTSTSMATTRPGNRSTSRDGGVRNFSSLPASLRQHDSEGFRVPRPQHVNDGVRTSADVGHSGASFSAFQPSAVTSVESTAQHSLAATSASSRAPNSGVTHVAALSASGHPYRARSRNFSTSVGRNVDSHVYLNTNVMSYYEVVPSATAAATTAAAASKEVDAVPLNAVSGARTTMSSFPRGSSPISSRVAATSEAAIDAAIGHHRRSVSKSPSTDQTKDANAVGFFEGVRSSRDAPTTHPCPSSSAAAAAPTPSQPPPPSSFADDTDSGDVAVVPMAGKYSAGDGRVRWGRPDALGGDGHVVRVVSGLLRCPTRDDLGAPQENESSLRSPLSDVDLTSGVLGGSGGVGGNARARGVGGVARGVAGGSAGAYQASNPISALLAGAGLHPNIHAAAPSPSSPPQPYRTTGHHGYTMSCDTGATLASQSDHNSRNARRPSPQGFWGGSRSNLAAYNVTAGNRHSRSGGNNASPRVSSPGGAEGRSVASATAGTPVPSPPHAARLRSPGNTGMPTSWTPRKPLQQPQQPQQSGRRNSSSTVAAPEAFSSDVRRSSNADTASGRPLSATGPLTSSFTPHRESGESSAARQPEAAAAAAAAAAAPSSQRAPHQRVLSSLKDVFLAASARSLSSINAGGASPTSPPPLHHQRVQSAAAAASLVGRRGGTGNGFSAPPPPPPRSLPLPPLPPTFALFGALERLSRFSELVELHREHTAVVDDFLSRLTLQLHRTTRGSTCSSSIGGGGGVSGDVHHDREFLRWHRILMFLFRNPSELVRVGVEFFSDAVNSWPLHMLYLACCFHVTASEHGFAALTAALRTGGIVSSGKGLFAALAVAMADGEVDFIRSTACMYQAAFYTGVLMRKRHQMFESETRLTASGGFTLLVVNIPISTLRRLVARVNEGYDVFVPMKTPGGDNSATVSSSAVGQSGVSPGGSPTLSSTQHVAFQPHSVIEVSRVISSRSAVVCGHPLDLLRLDMVLARFADFNGVKIHKEYLPAGGPENSNFFNKRMPHELLGLWRARGVSFSLASVRLPVYSPVNGELWADAAVAAVPSTSSVVAARAMGADMSGAALSLASPAVSAHRDELFMLLVAEAATAANQDLTYSLRHMRDGNVLLDFSTHAIGIGRLIAWTNKPIIVLAAPENRHELSAMPPPRRSPKDAAVLNTMEKLAVINDVLREVGASVEQPPNALAHPRVDLFTTFTELGLLEVMRGAAEVDQGDAALEGSGSNGLVRSSAPDSAQVLRAPARSVSDHQSGSGSGGGGWVSCSSLAPATASANHADRPTSPFDAASAPAPVAGRRMRWGAASTASTSVSIVVIDASNTATTGDVSVSFHPPSASQPPPPPPRSAAELATASPGEAAAAVVNTACPAGLPCTNGRAVGLGGASTTPPESPLSAAGRETLSTGNYTVESAAIAASSASSAVGILIAPPPTAVSIHREHRRGDGAGGSGSSSNSCAFAATTTTTNSSAASIVSNIAAAPLRESGVAAVADNVAASLLLRPPSAHRQTSQLSNSPSPPIGRCSLVSDMSPPYHARSRTHDVGQRGPQPQHEHGVFNLGTTTPARQASSEHDTPISPPALWHVGSPVSPAGGPVSAGATPVLANVVVEASEPAASASTNVLIASKDSSPHPSQQPRRVWSAASTAFPAHHPLSTSSPQDSSTNYNYCGNNATTTTTRRLRGIHTVLDAVEPESSGSGTGGVGLPASVRPQQQHQQQGTTPSQTELLPLSHGEEDFVIRRNNDYPGIVNVYQVSPLITYYEMQFNCVLCDGAVLFAGLLRKASGIAFPSYTLLLCPSVFALLELWDWFEFEELWRRSTGATLRSRAASPSSAGLR
ncbi:hypothetical protein ABB37_07402 [Leptomonas pyrrhocoris]|uniref:Uncharacterized protein n=1 Tax=Leptomonas pyrrhocoris TaxID=157538 RepID=A0A0M9FVY3_LEPPY|nr:hypothetical protein ABB37_07402 [Leptomonas pyrrhocoris]XP_015655508.1 hypothetical protein ABB37_07402 [Leptomonas pyrrhocoris]KPA77068.1 hypothetical protein ABB37_07402 [Leptomonas pyrrhocoris]KPA77069.1 hypothetical protein ABB37_07402 [Leptomonas pyrrhocoris]|eukprot:XP_015655507.1 hypothetical protein ABB37_07402 [Leptomonas pyrrhocoris]